MKNKILSYILKLHLWAEAAQKKAKQNNLSNTLFKFSFGLTLSSLLLAEAHAEGGIASMFTTAATQGDLIKGSAGKLFAAGGFCLAGLGGFNWWKKGKEGEQSRITAGQVWTPIVAGALLGATGYALIKAGETIGIQSSAQGALPT